VGASALAAAAHLRGNPRPAAATLVAGTAAAVSIGILLVLPSLERFKPVASFARRIRGVAPAAPAATYEFEEPSLDFYLDRPPIERLRGPADVVRWANRPAPALLVTTRDAWRALRGRDLPLAEVAAARGFNYSKGEPVELVALVRRPR
jgi:hypothetical protein